MSHPDDQPEEVEAWEWRTRETGWRRSLIQANHDIRRHYGGEYRAPTLIGQAVRIWTRYPDIK